jgi:hypothetical protein
MRPGLLLPAAAVLCLPACAASAPGQHAALATTALKTSHPAETRSSAHSRRSGSGPAGMVLVTGRFVLLGGALQRSGKQPPGRPLRGTVRFTLASSGPLGSRPVTSTAETVVAVGRSGRFDVWLRPGVYRVSGRTPQIVEVLPSGAQRPSTCAQPRPLTVTPRRTATVTVVCAVP